MKEALKLALYALKLGDTVFYPQTSIAIAAIEKALAQPAQRPWVGLTIEEIAACCMESTTTQFEFAQAIEAKLKEKNT